MREANLDRQILLVTGCPRSGTTALVRLLNTHPTVAVGVERFTRRLIDSKRLERELFEPERFTRFVDGDGNRVSFDGAATQAACAKADVARIIGDKSPNTGEVLSAAESIGDVLLLVILREPGAVARSYQVRADRARKDPEAAKYWPVWRGFRAAIEDFNQSVSDTLAFATKLNSDPALAARVRFKVVSYEALFRHRYAAADLFEFLGLSADDAVGLDDIYAEAKRLPSKKRRATLIDLFVAFKAKRRDYARALELAGQAA